MMGINIQDIDPGLGGGESSSNTINNGVVTSAAPNIVLNENDIERIRMAMVNADSMMNSFVGMVDKVLKSYDDNPVVQSFFESGNFGAEQKAVLESLKNGAKTLYDAICESDGLTSRTREFCDEQMRLINAERQTIKPRGNGD